MIGPDFFSLVLARDIGRAFWVLVLLLAMALIVGIAIGKWAL